MPDNNNNAPATPDNGQAPAAPAPAGNQPPTPAPAGQGDGNANNGGQKIEIDAKELDRLKRDAGRWNATVEQSRKERRENRRQTTTINSEDGDPELIEAIKVRDEKLTTLQVENLTYKVKDQLSEVMESEDYKELPDSFKRAIRKNPLAFADPRSRDVKDIIADIQDFMDDELDRIVSKAPAQPAGNNNAAPAGDKKDTPPVNGSGPSNPGSGSEVDIAGKTGTARSTAVLNGLLKGIGLKK